MTDDDDYEDYRNSLDEIIDGGGCMEALEATGEMRSEPTRKDLLGGPTDGVATTDPADDALAEVDADEATRTLRARYDSLDALRETLRATVSNDVLDALKVGGRVADLALDPPVCLKTFNAEAPVGAMTLVPHVTDEGAIDRLMTRVSDDVVVHAVPETGYSYAVVGGLDGQVIDADGVRELSGEPLDERVTGVDCDEEVALTTRYVQRETADGVVVETTCEAV
ncbi:hypothetical protein [Halococcoides cellulosivorans]|uniref:Uncharacterized protein n=1 Tax=Halococcoides cellulosivorans TaxID=1679096 RepID=A0A2R4WZ72_9EURY|nr:hypothetical protein [Halococcoides cellulosivorans]AWB26805.1 hypothetical protein HARCEL1_03275 [Halococcoides cellulosivorans]